MAQHTADTAASTTPVILLVEDDPSIASSLTTGLNLDGYEVIHCDSAELALSDASLERVSVALLDVRLPGQDGFSLCRTLRDRGLLFPVIMLTARDEEIDKVLGLEMGADDYMVKPYSYRELLSRIRAQLRRTNQYSNAPSPAQTVDNAIHFGEARIDRSAFRAFLGGEELMLTPVEFRMILTLAEHESQSLTREQIIRHVWGENYYLEDPRTVDVHIRHLREKFEVDPSQPKFIQTVRGHGYRFVKNP